MKYRLILIIFLILNCKLSIVNCQESREKFDYYFYEGILQKEKGDYAKALEIFNQCYAIDSLDAGLSAELGTLYAGYRDMEKAARYLKFAADKMPDNWWINLNLLSLYAQTDKMPAATALAERMQKYFPYKEEIYRILASLYQQEKQYKKAIAAFDKLENISAVREELTLEKYQLYMELKKPDKAISEIEKLIKKFPNDVNYRVLLGNAYLEQNKDEKALAIFNEVVQADPESPNLYMAFAEYYSKKGDSEQANAAIRKALLLEQLPIEHKVFILGQYVQTFVNDTAKLDETESLFRILVERYPLEAQVHSYYALFLQIRNRTAEAVLEIESALAIDSKNEEMWGQIISIYISEQKFDKVLETASNAIKNLPASVRFYYFKTIAQYQMEDYEGALATAKSAIELLGDNERLLKSDFYGQMGDIYYKLKQGSEAYAAFEEALKANPANIMIMNNYAYYLSEENIELRKAEAMSAKTVEKEPTNSTYLDTYAWIFYKQENYSLAKFYIERAIDNMDKTQPNGVIYEHYGDILFKTGNRQKALEMYKRAAEQTDATEEIKRKAAEM